MNSITVIEHESKSEAYGHLAAQDCKCAQFLLNNGFYRESAIFSIQAMEKYISASIERLNFKRPRFEVGEAHCLLLAIEHLKEAVSIYNKKRGKESPHIERAIAHFRDSLKEIGSHELHNNFRYPQHQRITPQGNPYGYSTGKWETSDAEESLASELLQKISVLCLYINDIESHCI